MSAAAKSGRDGEALSERENLFYNLPGCSGPVHGFSGVACKTLPFEIVEKTISPTIWRIADIAAQLRVYEFAPCCRSVQHDVVKYQFLIAYLARAGPLMV